MQNLQELMKHLFSFQTEGIVRRRDKIRGNKSWLIYLDTPEETETEAKRRISVLRSDLEKVCQDKDVKKYLTYELDLDLVCVDHRGYQLDLTLVQGLIGTSFRLMGHSSDIFGSSSHPLLLARASPRKVARYFLKNKIFPNYFEGKIPDIVNAEVERAIRDKERFEKIDREGGTWLERNDCP